ncbi:uncharacterized protein ACA1_372340 [Acanthamoeba castellanii str. Neff]|uniref:Uncharacterized protein n=1 Tax=Acanthamoeba castellanii (strain ATCC 30010 / Neff) TaxID=1257118 RepID=L8GGQ4_ACACF|nr:uncharacterized protein ACA1_372340 [Acanthamoeba castellanii str. Neff]ELR12265.1 hypothetical protein ACA1_372340 [Acanthamoeba castellanii str. Neff]
MRPGGSLNTMDIGIQPGFDSPALKKEYRLRAKNKNKYMLAYCHWLVFNKDINQMFSTFVIGMKYNPQVLTVKAFKQGLQDWYSAPQLTSIITAHIQNEG